MSNFRFSRNNSFEPLIHANGNRPDEKISLLFTAHYLMFASVSTTSLLSTYLSAMISADERFELHGFG